MASAYVPEGHKLEDEHWDTTNATSDAATALADQLADQRKAAADEAARQANAAADHRAKAARDAALK